MGKRHQAQRLGFGAEFLARLLLRLKGYQIIAKNLRTPVGEIDIIALKGRVLSIVEVKARASEDLALLSLRPPQVQRLERAAGAFIAKHPAYNQCDIRFDLVVVSANSWPKHIVDAWRARA